MEKIISIQPCPDGFYKRWEDEDKTTFEEKVLFLVFTIDTDEKKDFTIGPNIHAICSIDIREGYYVWAGDKNCLGVFNKSENDGRAANP